MVVRAKSTDPFPNVCFFCSPTHVVNLPCLLRPCQNRCRNGINCQFGAWVGAKGGSQQVGSCAITAVFCKQSQVKRGMRERSSVTTCSYPLEKRFTMAVAHVLPEATAGHVEKKLLILVSSSFVHSCDSNYSCILWPFVFLFNFDFCRQCGHFFSHQRGTIGFFSQLCMSNVSDSGSAIFHTNDAAGAGGRTATQLSCEFV